MAASWPGSCCGCVQDLGEGAFGGLGVGLQGGDQLARCTPSVCSATRMTSSRVPGRSVTAGVPAKFSSQRRHGVGEFVGHAGELVDEGGGEPVRPLRRRVSSGLCR